MDILPLIPDKSVQLILADLPYGTTSIDWDNVIPMDKLWEDKESKVVETADDVNVDELE